MELHPLTQEKAANLIGTPLGPLDVFQRRSSDGLHFRSFTRIMPSIYDADDKSSVFIGLFPVPLQEMAYDADQCVIVLSVKASEQLSVTTWKPFSIGSFEFIDDSQQRLLSRL
jgi:hypothetical protein